MAAYYNEIEPYAAKWLRSLIAHNLIAPGDVDERSIVDVQPDDLRGYTQCHFFAGIGGWSYALRLAGWPDDRPVWTGSCPCQPFSAAGKQRGSEDERHLWPAFFRLIRECRPATVFGEQVAGAAGLAWLDHVCADLEGAGYAAAAADLPACSVGAPHRRQRLWWVADAQQRAAERHGYAPAGEARGSEGEGNQWQRVRDDAGHGGVDDGMADTDRTGSLLSECNSEPQQPGQPAPCGNDADGCGAICGLHDTERARLEGHRTDQGPGGRIGTARSVATAGAFDQWADLEWLACSDGKARPTQSIVQQMADGLRNNLGYCGDGDRLVLSPLIQGTKNRVGRLRAYGNAITPQVASEFIGAYIDVVSV